MTEVDLDRVARLLEVAAECGGHSGKLSSIQAWAIGELIDINDQIKADAVEAAQAEREQAHVEQEPRETNLETDEGADEDDSTDDLTGSSIDPKANPVRRV